MALWNIAVLLKYRRTQRHRHSLGDEDCRKIVVSGYFFRKLDRVAPNISTEFGCTNYPIQPVEGFTWSGKKMYFVETFRNRFQQYFAPATEFTFAPSEFLVHLFTVMVAYAGGGTPTE